MEVKLPPLGEGVDSGSVVAILVKEGDQIAKGQGIIELETGKAVAPVPSPTAGKVTKIIVSVGDKISVGQPIASLEYGQGVRRATAETLRGRRCPCRKASFQGNLASGSAASAGRNIRGTGAGRGAGFRCADARSRADPSPDSAGIGN